MRARLNIEQIDVSGRVANYEVVAAVAYRAALE